MDYFLVIPGDLFEGQIRPALAQSRRLRSFEPCRSLCRSLLPAARAFRERYHSGSAESIVELLGERRGVSPPIPAPRGLTPPGSPRRAARQELPFDRDLWKQLVGEVLLFSAVEIPEFQLPADTWCCLLAPELYHAHLAGIDPADSQAFLGVRENFAAIQQALWGTHDLTLGPATYRPDQAGLNSRSEIERLAGYLEEIEPEEWQESALEGLRGCDEADRAEELAYAQEWFPELRDLFQRVSDNGQILVHERIF